MRLIVGLGNPGPEYQWTPHNLGFLAVDELANRGGIRVARPEAKALVGLGKLAGQEIILAKPQTFMNLSGISVRELLERYQLGPEDLLAMWDEVQLPWGAIRIHAEGSAGSHNGAGSLISSLGTPAIRRLRLGCGPDHPLANKEGYVYMSNVNSIEEMTNMISANRTFATNVEAINTARDLLLKTISMGH